MKLAPVFPLAKRIGLTLSLLAMWSPFLTGATPETPSNPLASSINGLGLDLYRELAAASDGNILLSPYSIELALAMACAGADGKTKVEMQRVLRLPADDKTTADQFGRFAKELEATAAKSKSRLEFLEHYGGSGSPTELTVANRLFAQKGYPLKEPYVSLLGNAAFYRSPLEQLDFRSQSEKARETINSWVEKQTKAKITNLIPQGGVTTDTRLVLANAIYLRAPWQHEFSESRTTPQKFFVNGKTPVDVPTMKQKEHYGYAKMRDFTAVSIPFAENDLSFLILLPDAADGLAKLEKEIAPETFPEVSRAMSANMMKNPGGGVELYLPKFRMEPSTVPLSKTLRKLGMRTAFDEPKGSANFDRMAQRRGDDYLYVGEVFHKAFLALDEKGVEAAAATAIPFAAGSAGPSDKPPVVRVDHPFLFAIQHHETCLFLGRVTDPR